MADPAALLENWKAHTATDLNMLKEKFGEMVDTMVAKLEMDPVKTDLTKAVFGGIMGGYINLHEENIALKAKLASVKEDLLAYKQDVVAQTHRDDEEFLDGVIRLCSPS